MSCICSALEDTQRTVSFVYEFYHLKNVQDVLIKSDIITGVIYTIIYSYILHLEWNHTLDW